MTKVKCHLGKQCLISIYYFPVYSFLIYDCLLWGNNYDSPLSQLIRLRNKAVRIMNDTSLRDLIAPYYTNSGLLKFRDIVKLHSCLFFYEHLCESKPSNFPLTLVSEQHNYFTRGASALQRIPTSLTMMHLNLQVMILSIHQSLLQTF